MKFDLMVYSRGVERLDGYQLFTAPSYWSEKMTDYMARFNELRDADLENPLAADPQSWSKTYLFVCLPPPYCCALLRCVRAEGSTSGTWLEDFMNRPIWSVEGICCPPEQREYFFALLPSLLLWMEQNPCSLYQSLRDSRMKQNTIEIPPELVINPYSEESPPEIISTVFPEEAQQNNWLALCHKIYVSAQPFPFLYGTLAEAFAGQLGKEYGIQEIFCPSAPEMELDTAADPFRRRKFISKRKSKHKSYKYQLGLRFRQDGKASARCWEIQEEKRQTESMQSGWKPVNQEDGLPMIQLVSEAYGVREFVRKMHWDVSADTAETHLLYTFRKEE